MLFFWPIGSLCRHIRWTASRSYTDNWDHWNQLECSWSCQMGFMGFHSQSMPPQSKTLYLSLQPRSQQYSPLPRGYKATYFLSQIYTTAIRLINTWCSEVSASTLIRPWPITPIALADHGPSLCKTLSYMLWCFPYTLTELSSTSSNGFQGDLVAKITP